MQDKANTLDGIALDLAFALLSEEQLCHLFFCYYLVCFPAPRRFSSGSYEASNVPVLTVSIISKSAFLRTAGREAPGVAAQPTPRGPSLSP